MGAPTESVGQQYPGLNEEEVVLVEGLLGRLAPGFLPLPVFNQVARLVTTPTVEIVPIRDGQEGGPEVFMTQRAADDPHWPGQWHVPGTVIRSTDTMDHRFTSGINLDKVFGRLHKSEMLGQLTLLGPERFVGTNFWGVERGVEFSPYFYVPVAAAVPDDELTVGRFFPGDELPDNTISHHAIFIPRAVEAYRQDKSSVPA